MTCIVGLKQNGKVYIGADGAASNGSKTVKTDIEKVFKTNSFIIGYTTSFRMGQLLQYYLKDVSIKKDGQTDMEYLVQTFIPYIQKTFKDNGFSKIDSNQEKAGYFIMAYNQELYFIQSDYSVLKYSDGYCCTGCGEEYALGSLHTTKDSELPPEDRVTRALEAAAYFSDGVSEPFTILHND